MALKLFTRKPKTPSEPKAKPVKQPKEKKAPKAKPAPQPKAKRGSKVDKPAQVLQPVPEAINKVENKVEEIPLPPPVMPTKPEPVMEEDDDKTTESSTGGEATPEEAPAAEPVEQDTKEMAMTEDVEEVQSKDNESSWNGCGCDPEVFKNLKSAVGFKV